MLWSATVEQFNLRRVSVRRNIRMVANFTKFPIGCLSLNGPVDQSFNCIAIELFSLLS